jgi:hypothetical protein
LTAGVTDILDLRLDWKTPPAWPKGSLTIASWRLSRPANGPKNGTRQRKAAARADLIGSIYGHHGKDLEGLEQTL